MFKCNILWQGCNVILMCIVLGPSQEVFERLQFHHSLERQRLVDIPFHHDHGPWYDITPGCVHGIPRYSNGLILVLCQTVRMQE